MKRTKISVIIPTYNRLGLLKQTIRTVVEQKNKEVEVIVIDNESRDGTREWLNSSGLNAGVDKWQVEPKRGPSAARNRGVRLAEGEVLAFLDDDCVVQKDWLMHIRNVIDEEGVGSRLVFQGGIEHWFERPSWREQMFLKRSEIARKKIKTTVMYKEGNYVDGVLAGNFFVKRKVWDILDNGFDERWFPFVGEERDVAIRFQLRGVPIKLVENVTVKHMKQNRWIGWGIMTAWRYGRADGLLKAKYLTSVPNAVGWGEVGNGEITVRQILKDLGWRGWRWWRGYLYGSTMAGIRKLGSWWFERWYRLSLILFNN